MDLFSSDNEAFRVLFTLPPIKASAGTALAVPEMPKESATTGDREIDAVLWLQSVVATGHQAYVDKALEAVTRIKTPMKVLEKRYMAILQKSGAHAFQILFGTMDFGEIELLANKAIKKSRDRHEALARFGSVESLFADTPAEKACRKALRGLKAGVVGLFDKEPSYARFSKYPSLVPATIGDCLHARDYWRDLCRLRYATEDYGDNSPQSFAHECYCLAMLAHIRPRDAAEAISAFDHVAESDSVHSDEERPIMRNLIVSGWEFANQVTQHQPTEVLV
ncbi:hypothetical protein WCQ02_30950 [Paraburkholderia tropica]|uniref:hypothetical protein n=1 Tax=Paraburkholderia tropica TaxID=92647 RepID=UPI0030184735